MAQGKRGSSGGKKRGKRASTPATGDADEREPLDAEPVAKADADGDADGEAEPVDGEPGEPDLAELEQQGDADVIDVSLATGPGMSADGERAPLAPVSSRGVGRADPLTSYMQEIRRYPLLTREEEHELAAKFVETGDPALAKQLITANLRLVVKIAHEYRRAHRNLLDLVQEGNIGLMQAVRKYDPMRGVKLSSYAAWWIRAYILKFILNNWRMVKIGTTQAQRKLFFNLRKEKEKLEKLGFAADHKLLAERLDVTEAEVAEMDQRLAGSDMSLDAPLGGDESDGRTRMDSMAGSPGSRPDVAVEQHEFRTLLRQKLEQFADRLTGRDQTLFRERWLSDSPKTLQEIGDSFGISRERARQLEKRMLDKLRVFLEAELGSAVDIGAMVEE